MAGKDDSLQSINTQLDGKRVLNKAKFGQQQKNEQPHSFGTPPQFDDAAPSVDAESSTVPPSALDPRGGQYFPWRLRSLSLAKYEPHRIEIARGTWSMRGLRPN
ncbi:hypothetical protein HAX54_044263 [Datura stramonium]|uniref:Uncharacterized protein n=1 Tax=Datura stramonium TaxID=4076 RepID=A0ABS8SPL6_DATST|nr:hypothetical protein [Datura stramonium]